VCKRPQNCCMLFWFYKKAPKMKVQAFFWGHLLICLFSGNLGEISAKMVLAVSRFEELRQLKCNRFFFGGHFLWSFFRASLGKFGQNLFSPPKIYLLLHLWPQGSHNHKWLTPSTAQILFHMYCVYYTAHFIVALLRLCPRRRPDCRF